MENKIVNSRKAGNFFIIGASVGLGGGLFLMTTSFIFLAISYFDRLVYRGLDAALFAAGFIFLAIGANFLDLMEEKKKTKRIEYCRENGLTSELFQ